MKLFAPGFLAAAIAGLVYPQSSVVGASPQPTSLVAGDGYVAMGSSFAAGPGVGRLAIPAAADCQRSADNYAGTLARKRGFALADVTCSGATTQDILAPHGNLPPQIDAVKPDTRLVTVTIGGNDVNYIGALIGASCNLLQAGRFAPGGKCPESRTVSDREWDGLYSRLRRIIGEIRKRSPEARIVLVDYLAVLPEHGGCDAAPMLPDKADEARATARRLADVTARAAGDGRAEILRASRLSRSHDACGRQPWVTGFPSGPGQAFVPYHPNLAGMQAVADALNTLISRPPARRR